MTNITINFDNARKISVKKWNGKRQTYYVEQLQDYTYNVTDSKKYKSLYKQVDCFSLDLLKKALEMYEAHMGRISLQACCNFVTQNS